MYGYPIDGSPPVVDIQNSGIAQEKFYCFVLREDGTIFYTIRNQFERKIEGTTQITDFKELYKVNDNNYIRIVDQEQGPTGQEAITNSSKIGGIFRD